MFEVGEQIKFDTKAGMLAQLTHSVLSAEILPCFYFTVAKWQSNKPALLKEFFTLSWSNDLLIVRSSAKHEDSIKSSKAGCYTSLLNVQGEAALVDAVGLVIDSYHGGDLEDQVLIQPMLQDCQLSGVAFTVDQNSGAPYFIINYDDESGRTDTVTSGSGPCLKKYIHHVASQVKPPIALCKVVELLHELSAIFNNQPLDIEFALDKNHQLYLFQVRPLILHHEVFVDIDRHALLLKRIEYRLKEISKPHPYLYGQKGMYGVMPDWNPAEVIGFRPRPLALSLYRELITDSVWAYQRDNYGYSNLRSFPLMVDFSGLPYIDVRVSLNSFIPKEIPKKISEKLVEYYLDRLRSNPALHDKLEFDVVFSCYAFNISDRLNQLVDDDFSEEECRIIKSHLVVLTNSILHKTHGYWKSDLSKAEDLSRRQYLILKSDLSIESKLYWLVEDCKRYGTLPFAGLARAAFIAMQILRSIQMVGIISDEEYHAFLQSLNTVTRKMKEDVYRLSRDEFLKQYAHLRPGTYDIMSPSYSQNFDRYFGDIKKADREAEVKLDFKLSVRQLKEIQDYLDSDKLDITALELLHFIREAIEAREYSKFIFTKSVSEFLDLLATYASQYGISREDCAYADVQDVLTLNSSAEDPEKVLHDSITRGKKKSKSTNLVNLPALIVSPEQVWSYHAILSQPNFITRASILANVVSIDSYEKTCDGVILLIPGADPGYDWIFTQNISGFITQYGGANSHMAIRAAELNIPAVIGVGSIQYEQYQKARRLLIDCEKKQVKVIL